MTPLSDRRSPSASHRQHPNEPLVLLDYDAAVGIASPDDAVRAAIRRAVVALADRVAALAAEDCRTDETAQLAAALGALLPHVDARAA